MGDALTALREWKKERYGEAAKETMTGRSASSDIENKKQRDPLTALREWKRERYGVTDNSHIQTGSARDSGVRRSYAARDHEQEEIVAGLNSGAVRYETGKRELEELSAAYDANPNEETATAYNQRLEAFQRDLDDYNSYVERYNHYNSSEGVKERHAAAREKMKAAEEDLRYAQAMVELREDEGYISQEEVDRAKGELERARKAYDDTVKEYNGLGSLYYYTENEEQIARMLEDTDASDIHSYAKELQSDMDKLLVVLNYHSPSGGIVSDVGQIREIETYLGEKYGLDGDALNGAAAFGRAYGTARRADGGYTSGWALYDELETKKGEAVKLLSNKEYDHDRMVEYEQRLADKAEYEQQQAAWAKYIDENPWTASVGASIASILVAPAQGLDYLKTMASGIGHSDLGDLDNYVPMNVYAMDATNFVSTVRDTVSKEIEANTNWELMGQNVWSFLYQTGMSIGDSAVQVATFGSFAPAVMGAGAASNQAKNILERGGSNRQALVGGLAAGAAEMLFEKFSVERLMSIKNVHGWRAVLEKTAKQMGAEASEEAFTEIANILADAAIMGDKSEYAMAVQEYMRTMSEEEAKERAFLDCVGQVALAGIGGALSGFAMGGSVSTASAVVNHFDEKKVGTKMQKYGDEAVKAAIETGLYSKMGTESRRMAEKLLDKYTDGKKISDAEIGALIMANESATAEGNVRGTAENALEKLAQEKVAEENAQKAADDAMEAKASVPVPYNVINLGRTSTNGVEKLGYREHGTKAFETVLESTGMTVDQAKLYFDTPYEAGLTNMNPKVVASGNDIQKAAFAAGLRDYGAKQKELQERSERWAEYTSVASNKDAGFKYDPAELPSDVTQDEADVLDLLGQVFGTTIRLGSLSANAQITAAGDVTIDKNFQRIVKNGEKRNIVFYGAHEIGMHRLMQLAPVEGQAFIDAMIQHKNRGLPYGAVTETQDKQKDYSSQNVGLNVDKAMEEVSADSILRLYNNDVEAFREALERIANGKNDQAKAGARKFKDILNDIIEKLKTLWNKLRGKGEDQVRAEVKQTIDEMEHLRNLFEKALSVAAERVKTEQSNASKNDLSEKSTNETGRSDNSGDIMLSAKARRGRSIEVETMENNRFQRLRQFHDDLPPQWYAYTKDYFYVYTNHSFMDYTLLAKVRITDKNRLYINKIEERIKNVTYESAETFDRWIKNFWRGKGRDSWHYVGVGKAGTTGRNDGVDVRERGREHIGYSVENGGVGKQSIGELASRLDYLTKQLDRSNLAKEKKTEIRREIANVKKELRKRMNPYSTGADITEGNKNTVQQDGVQLSVKEYSTIREKMAKAALDKLSDKLGEQFPLSARFNAYIRNTKEAILAPTVVANAISLNGKSYYGAAKAEFIKQYPKDETVNMAGTGTVAKLRTDVATESMSKRLNRGDEQVLLDIIPHAKNLIASGKLLGIERLAHTENKPSGLFAYRVYNVFDYSTTDAKTKTVTTTPYVFVATVVQQYDGASIVHVIRGIEVATYDRGKLGIPEESSAIKGGRYSVSQLYKYVKNIPRAAGGLKYTNQETDDYLFRYTQKEDGTMFSLKEEDSDILQENAKLKQVNQALREQFKVTKFGTVDKKSLDAYTKKLLKDYESGADIEETREMFADLFSYMQKAVEGKTPADEDTWAVIQKKAYDAAVHILENSVTVDDAMWQETKEIRDTLRTTGITINKEYDHDLMGYESINEFRKANFGRIKIVNEGVPLDVFYDELCSMYPGYFDDSIYTQPDQLMAIEEFLERIKPTEVNMFSYDMRNAATMMATDIIERVYALPQAKPTFADKKNAQIAAAKAQGDQKARDAYLAGAMRQGRDMAKAATAERERMEAQIAVAKKNIDDFRQKVKDVRKQEKAAKWEAVDKVKKHYQAKEAKMSENRKAQILRAQVVRHAQGLSKKLLRGTDKQHIPQGLQGAVAELLAAINLESGYTYDPASNSYKKSDAGLPTRRTEEFLRVKAQYEAIAANNDYDMVLDPSLLGVPAEGIPSMLDKVIAMKDIRIVDMTISQLNTILDVVRAIEHSITTAGKMLTRSKWARTSEAAAAFMADTATRRAKRSLTERHYMLDIETPYTFFSHFGEAGHDFFRMLREAQDAEQTMQDQVVDRVGKVVSEEARKKAEKETVEFTTAATGEKLTLSKAHMMELYLLSKRPQALNHLLRGGIIQPKVGKVRRGTETIKLTELDLAKITSELTDEERKIADGLQKITLLLAEWGNKASLQAYGYEKFKDPNYWTIKSASEGISQDVEKGQNKPRSISNMGSAKSVVPEASNTLDIGGIFNTFDQHVSDMLTYSAWLTTMEDANRLFNYKFRDENWNLTGKNMKALLNKYGGDGSTQYWLRLMEDIQNCLSVVSDTSTENIATKTIGSVKKASVAGNLRVVVQQPTAYLRALAVLDADSMAVALGKNTVVKPMLNGWEKAVKYAPIAARKAAGGFEISSNPRQLAEIMYKPESKLGKAKDVAKEAPLWMAGKMDQVTWGTIWNACEHQVGKNNSNLTKGSLDFYEAVAELFTEVIDQTQVVDGVLQRSQAMRSGSNFMKQMTSFTGEPTQAANVVIRAWDKLRYETDPKKRSEAIKGLSRAVSAYMITSILNAFAQSLVDGLRDDDDEKGYWEKVWAAFSGINGKEETWKDFCRNILLASNAMNNINPATWLPIWKDVFSLLQGYSVKRMDAATIEDFIDSVGNAMKSFSGEGKYTIGYATLKTLVAGGKIFGSSAYNVLRDVEGVVRTFNVATDDLMAQYNTEKLVTRPANNLKPYLNILYSAYETDKGAYEEMYEDLIASGVDANDIKDGMEDRMKKAQGVKRVDDLKQRYLTPDQQKSYDKKLQTVKKSSQWGKATEEQRKETESRLYDLETMNASGAAMQEYIDAGKAYGLSETEYLLYQLALEIYDTPNKSGEYGGAPTNAEKADAILSISGLGESEMAYLWDTDDGYDAYANGVDMAAYITRLGDGQRADVEKLIEAQEVGIENDSYYDFLDMLDKYDKPTESGKLGTFTQDEAAAAIAAMPGLTRDQRAYLWQSVNKGWKASRNPWR